MRGYGGYGVTSCDHGRGLGLLPVETITAKEAKNRFACGGKHLGRPLGAQNGLQCGLSGNSVTLKATERSIF